MTDRTLPIQPFRPRLSSLGCGGVLLAALLGLGGCASTGDKPSAPEAPSASRAVGYALSLQGIPYRPGKERPDEGFDCSGFVRHVYSRQGILLPRRVRDMAYQLPTVDKDERQPGDLVFFNTSGQPFSHVGIYVGDDRFVHAPSPRTGRVMVSSLDLAYWRQRFIGVRRPLWSGTWTSGALWREPSITR